MTDRAAVLLGGILGFLLALAFIITGSSISILAHK